MKEADVEADIFTERKQRGGCLTTHKLLLYVCLLLIRETTNSHLLAVYSVSIY